MSCIEKDAVCQLFKIEDLVSKIPRDQRIWTKDKYIEFIRKLSKQLEVKKKIFLRLANAEEDKEEEEIFEPKDQA